MSFTVREGVGRNMLTEPSVRETAQIFWLPDGRLSAISARLLATSISNAVAFVIPLPSVTMTGEETPSRTILRRPSPGRALQEHADRAVGEGDRANFLAAGRETVP